MELLRTALMSRTGGRPRGATSILAVLISCASTLAAVPCDAEDMRARFDNEAQLAWARLVDMSRHSDVERVDTKYYSDGLEVQSLWGAKLNDSNALTSVEWLKGPETSNDRPGTARVICCNSRYGFRLLRSGKDLPWYVREVNSDVAEMYQQCVNEGALTYAQFTILGGLFRLPDKVKDKAFVIVSVDAQDTAEGALAALRFENKDPDTDSFRWVQRGTLYLNPNRMWAIQSFEVEVLISKTKEERWEKFKSEFLPGPDDFPIIKRCEFQYGPKGGGVELRVSHVYTRFELRDVPESEFTLSAFGLPEIGGPSRSNHLWMALVAAGVLCTAVAIYLRRRASSP